jgi:site-specific recombinase XerD
MQDGELARLLYGEQAVEPDERLRLWAAAFEAWLEERRTKYSRDIGPESQRAWAEFLAMTHKAPYEVGTAEVEAYIEALQEKGLKTGTIFKRLTGLSSFYQYCSAQGIDGPALTPGFNPAAKAHRPGLKRNEKAETLSKEAEEALLEVIRNDPSVIGKRDLALFSLLLRTGCRAKEARNLQWGQVEVEGGRVLQG